MVYYYWNTPISCISNTKRCITDLNTFCTGTHFQIPNVQKWKLGWSGKKANRYFVTNHNRITLHAWHAQEKCCSTEFESKFVGKSPTSINHCQQFCSIQLHKWNECLMALKLPCIHQTHTQPAQKWTHLWFQKKTTKQ